jgi:plastocyanin
MTVPRLIPALMLLFATTASSFAQATIEGRVELAKRKSAPVAAQRYEIVSNHGILATNPPLAVVYLETPSAPPASGLSKEVMQKDLGFVPALLPIQVGTRVEFPNHDDTYHNVFSYSPAKRFDLGRYRPDEKPVPFQIFDKPGLVTLRCDIHEHMRGLILVLDTPYFSLTDQNGGFRLSKLPAGDYVLKAWIDSKTTREKPVHLTAGQTLHTDSP